MLCDLVCSSAQDELGTEEGLPLPQSDYESFSDEIHSTDWNTKFEKKTLNQKWDAFKDVYQECVEKYVPHKLVKPNQRHKPPWTNFKSMEKAKFRRRRATVRAKTSDLYAYKMKAEQADQDVRETVHCAKSDFENNLVNQIKTEPKKFFNYIRHFTISSSTVDDSLHSLQCSHHITVLQH